MVRSQDPTIRGEHEKELILWSVDALLLDLGGQERWRDLLLGRCLEMRLVSRPGKDVRWHLRIARSTVEETGLLREA